MTNTLPLYPPLFLPVILGLDPGIQSLRLSGFPPFPPFLKTGRGCPQRRIHYNRMCGALWPLGRPGDAEEWRSPFLFLARSLQQCDSRDLGRLCTLASGGAGYPYPLRGQIILEHRYLRSNNSTGSFFVCPPRESGSH
jgi:hypothetical protein